MSHKIIRMFCLVLSLCLGLGLMAGGLVPVASAASNTYQLADLLTEGKIKPLGRTQVSTTGDGITANWSANGFEANLTITTGDIVIGYNSTGYNKDKDATYAAVLVDGEQVWRGLAIGTGTVRIPVTPGTHTISAIRETGHNSNAGASFLFTTLAFDGTVETKPADKALYIEVIGDSFACGAGSAAAYAPGVQWNDIDNSAQASFGWYLSKMLKSDLSIVARGGIGLLGTSDGAQEEVDNSANMIGIYPYASGHNQSEGLYDFSSARKPDLVIIELGANDKITDSASVDTWNSQLDSMINLVRSNYGASTKILLLSHKGDIYAQMLKKADSDENIWSCHFSHHGNGSAAVNTQKEGHPSAEDEYEIAEALYKSIQDWDILGAPAQTEPTYNDIIYYVSQAGNDTNDGKTLDTAKATLNAALKQAQTDNGSYKFTAGTRIVVKVDGTVQNNAAANNALGATQIFIENGTKIKDHKHIPVLITTNDYNGTNAVIQVTTDAGSNNDALLRVVNDFYLKDITIQSLTNDKGYCAHRFYASGCHVTFDNALMTTDGTAGTVSEEDNNRWIISASNVTTGGLNPTSATHLPMTGTVTFKNGDYTNLNYVAAVSNDSLTNETTDLPQVHCNVFIEDGAQMGDVYGLYGTLAVETATVTFNGGTVANYQATRSGTSNSARLTYKTSLTTVFNGGSIENDTYYGTGDYINLTGNVTTEFKKGQFTGRVFAGLGKRVTLTGSVTNNISGGEIRVVPVSTTGGVDGFYLGGHEYADISGDVTNNISGGDLNLLYTANANAGIYMGLRRGTIRGSLINNISGGNLYVAQYASEIASSGIFLGSYSGDILTRLENNITGGTFCLNNDGTLSFGIQTTKNHIGSIETVIGKEGDLRGPRFLGNISIGGSWARVGRELDHTETSTDWTTINGQKHPLPDYCTDNVVIQTTIYSGYFGGTFQASLSSTNIENGYIIGSVQTDIYGGKFSQAFYGTGGSDILGHVTTNIYGGSFTSIYGADDAYVYDGVETNIYGLTELINIGSDPDYRIYAGGTSGSINTLDPNEDAVKLTVAPTADTQLWLKTPIYSGCSSANGVINGNCTVEIRGGIFPNGLKVDGKTVANVLPSGYTAVNYYTSEELSYTDSDTALDGYVEVVPSGQSSSRELVYYVRLYGNDSRDGLTYITAKKTVNAAFAQAVADNGGSTVFPNGSELTIYVNGTVSDGSDQPLLYGSYLRTEDGSPLDITVTTYAYSDTKATIVHNYAATESDAAKAYACTDLKLKDINLMSKAQDSGKYQTLQLLAAGHTITFDNASLITNNAQKWIVSADHFTTDGLDPTAATEENPVHGTLIFRNGNYLDLDYVTTVVSDTISSATETPHMHCKVIIEDGAIMDDVYGPVGALKVGSSTVEVRGGTVNTLKGTGDDTTANTDTTLSIYSGTVDTLKGTGDGAAVTLTGNVNITVSDGTVNAYYGTGDSVTVTGKVSNTITGGTVNNFSGTGLGTSSSYIKVGSVENNISGGTFGGNYFWGAGKYVTVTGNISNTISNATMTISAKAANDSYWFAGRDYVSAENVYNTISSGQFNVAFDSAVASTIYFGGSQRAAISGDVINKFTGGTFSFVDNNAVGTGCGFFLGAYSGNIFGTLRNEIGGVTFDSTKTKPAAALTCGSQSTKTVFGKIENIFGDPDTGAGPTLTEGDLRLVGNNGQVGVDSPLSAYPGKNDTINTTKTVVVSNTFYGGTFGTCYGATGDATTSRYNMVYGSVTTNIYGGSFDRFFGSGSAPVYGHVTTNIYGGSFNRIYGANSGKVYDGVELNIYGMTEGSNPTGIWAGGVKSTIESLSGTHHGVKLNIAPQGELTLSMPISASGSTSATVTGGTVVSVSGGTYTNGFGVTGV